MKSNLTRFVIIEKQWNYTFIIQNSTNKQQTHNHTQTNAMVYRSLFITTMPKYGFLKRTSRNKTKDEQHWRWGKKISSPYLIIQHYDSFDNSNDDTIIRNLSPLQYNNQIQCPFSLSSSQSLSSCPRHRNYKEISTTSMVNTSTVTSSTSTITSYSNSNGNTDGGKEENDDDTYYRRRIREEGSAE